jgi:hypothetical protein
MKKPRHPSLPSFAPVRKLAEQLLNHAPQAVVRNLDFYRQVEQQLLAKRTPCPAGATPLSPRRAEW